MYAPYSFQFSISAAFCTARCFFSKGCVCLVYTSWPKEWHLTRTSNPCYSLVINKAHIVVEGNWEDKLRLGGDSFHLSVHAFWKMYWLTIRTEEGKYGQISADFSESETESFLPQQAALYCFVFHIHCTLGLSSVHTNTVSGFADKQLPTNYIKDHLLYIKGIKCRYDLNVRCCLWYFLNLINEKASFFMSW